MIRILLTTLLCLFTFNASALAFNTSAKQAIVIDYETGQVLFEKNAGVQMPTSSMSKVMTAYMAFDALKSGRISLSDTFKVSEKAWQKGGSKMFVEVNTRVSIEDLLYGIIVQSGNDATIVLAEGLMQREEDFARVMTLKAKEIGMNDTNFVNASGWPDPGHYSTARDLATMSQALIRNFPDYYGYYSEEEFTYNEITQSNRNPLLYQNIRADGIKTGHTEIAGFGLIGSGVALDGRRVIFVLNGLDSEAARAQESKRVMEWAYDNFEIRTALTKDQMLADIAVSLGEAQSVAAIMNEDVSLIVPINDAKPVIEVHYSEPLLAPITAGQQIGSVSVKSEYEVRQFPLVAAQDVAEAGLFETFIQKLTLMIGNL